MPAYKDKTRGTWYVKISGKDPVTGKRTQKMKRGFPTKKEALQWEAVQIVADTKSTALTFREMDEKYIAYKNPKKETTRTQERMRVSKYMPFADQPMNKIKKADLLEWYTEIAGADFSAGLKDYLVGVVKSVFKFANDFYGLPNEAVGLKRFKQKKVKEFETWTPEEFNRFIVCVKGYHFRNLFTVLFWTGIRRCEAMALRIEDYDGETLEIYHQLKLEKEGFFDLKTDASVRSLKVTAPVKAVLKPIQADLDYNGYLFGYEHPLALTTIRRAFMAGIEASGVKKIRIHDLRHSFATNAIGAGVNIVALSKYLGHSTIRQTLETYVHALEKTENEMIDIMNKLAEN